MRHCSFAAATLAAVAVCGIQTSAAREESRPALTERQEERAWAALNASFSRAMTRSSNSGQAAIRAAGPTLTPAQSLSAVNVSSLSLSDDGELVVYQYEQASAADDKTEHFAVVQYARPGATLVHLNFGTIRSLAFVPGSHDLAFVQDAEEGSQVRIAAQPYSSSRELLRTAGRIGTIQFSPDGSRLAYTTVSTPAFTPLYRRLQEESNPILVNAAELSLFNFVYGAFPLGAPSPDVQLHYRDVTSNAVTTISVPGAVNEFIWSADGTQLSVEYSDPRIRPAYDLNTSVGIYSTIESEFRVLAQAAMASDGVPQTYYRGGEWVPSENRILVRRFKFREAWVSPNYAEWTTVRADQLATDRSLVWFPLDAYPGRELYPIDRQSLYQQSTVFGVRQLSIQTNGQSERASFLSGVVGNATNFSFSSDRRTIAFINESFTRPDEVMVWRASDGRAMTISDLNSATAARIGDAYTYEHISWTSSDGTLAYGWLIRPHDGATRHPLLTYVHGGPIAAVTDSFMGHSRGWAIPIEALAAHGIAVFIPNYRSTPSYGESYQAAGRPEVEPALDVATGIQYLIEQGIADPHRLGISGHSHGAWLGPLINTRLHVFRASQFVEGTSNFFDNYSMVPAELVDLVYHPIFGDPRSDPMRYVRMSPNLHYQGVYTAGLFMSGGEWQAIPMIGMQKAAFMVGAPVEAMVFPRTGHTISSQRLMLVAADVSFDWFRFWLQDIEDDEPAKQDQYRRWRQLRHDQCALPGLPPGHCTASIQ